jgi:uncharacterized membrane protein
MLPPLNIGLLSNVSYDACMALVVLASRYSEVHPYYSVLFWTLIGWVIWMIIGLREGLQFFLALT